MRLHHPIGHATWREIGYGVTLTLLTLLASLDCRIALQVQKFWRAAKNLTVRFVEWMQGAFAAHPGADLQTKLFGQHELYSCLCQNDADFQIAVGTHAC